MVGPVVHHEPLFAERRRQGASKLSQRSELARDTGPQHSGAILVRERSDARSCQVQRRHPRAAASQSAFRGAYLAVRDLAKEGQR